MRCALAAEGSASGAMVGSTSLSLVLAAVGSYLAMDDVQVSYIW
jgi:hypothetical protein